VLAHLAWSGQPARFFVPGPGALPGAKSGAQPSALARPFPPSPDDAIDPKTMGMAGARERVLLHRRRMKAGGGREHKQYPPSP
jgi:hypothetical protein